MRNVKKFVVTFIAVMFMIIMAEPVFCFANETELVEVSITSEKAEYFYGDEFKLNVKVQNNNSYNINDIKLSGVLPEYIKNVKNINYSMELEAFETKNYEIVGQFEGSKAPSTGDNKGYFGYLIGVMALSLITVIVLKCKKVRQNFIVFVCITSILFSGIDINAFASNDVNRIKSIEEKLGLKYEGKDFDAIIKAEYTENNIIIVNTKPLGEVAADGSYTINDRFNILNGTLHNHEIIEKFEYQINDMKGLTVSEGKIEIKEEWNMSDFGLVVGGNEIILKATDKGGEVYSESLIIFNSLEENMKNTSVDMSDVDGDGLIAYYESWFSTDSGKADTDGDGLDDDKELYVYGTDATKIDTDGDGIIDSCEDFDEDGLSLKEEVDLGTDYFDKDTDDDEIPDGKEVKLYNTNPKLEDTDEDGVSDGREIEIGTNPLIKDTDGNGILDGDEVTNQKINFSLEDSEKSVAISSVSVTLDSPGNIKDHVTIENTEDIDILSTEVVGRIGAPVSIETDVEFNTAHITFTYNEDLLGDTPVENLAIMWYDEENMTYRILDKESVIDKEAKTITYTTTHFSTYLVVDRQIWYDVWKTPIDYRDGLSENQTKYDVSLVVDVSGSMSGSYIERAKIALNSFIDAMYEEDMSCLVSFNSYAKLICGFTSDKEVLRSKIGSLYASGGTNTDSGLQLALNHLISNGNSDNTQIVVMICDGDVNYVQSTIDRAIEAGIVIYTINVVNGNNALLEKISQQTGGQYYYAAASDEITEKINEIRSGTLDLVDTTDTDGDGIYDVYETKGIMIQNGQIITTDANNPDTDGDGISDFDEIGGLPKIGNFDFLIGKFTHLLCAILSNPKVKDSDGDSVVDSDDLYPNKKAEYADEYEQVENYNFDYYNYYMPDTMREAIKESKSVYGKGNYGFKKMAKIRMNKALAYLFVSEGRLTGLAQNAALALEWYLANRGIDKKLSTIEMGSYLHTDYALKCYNEEYMKAKEFAEDVLKDGDSIIVARIGVFSSYNKEEFFKLSILSMNDLNWLATLGDSSGALVAKITRNGNDYKMEFKYILFDFYDYDIDDKDKVFIAVLSDKDLAEMHRAGIARDYFHYGELDNILWWSK